MQSHVSRGTFLIHLFRHFCFNIVSPQCTLSQTHTDRQTDVIMMTIADHTTWQYDRLKQLLRDTYLF